MNALPATPADLAWLRARVPVKIVEQMITEKEIVVIGEEKNGTNH